MSNISNRKRVYLYRQRIKEKGGVVVYAIITSPEAIKAWEELQRIYGSNRDAIEAAIIDSYEQIKESK